MSDEAQEKTECVKCSKCSKETDLAMAMRMEFDIHSGTFGHSYNVKTALCWTCGQAIERLVSKFVHEDTYGLV